MEIIVVSIVMLVGVIYGYYTVSGSGIAETPYGNRLLADVEMAEPPDLAEAVGFAGFLLEPSDQHHLTEPAAVLVRLSRVESLGLGLGTGGGRFSHSGLRSLQRDPSPLPRFARGKAQDASPRLAPAPRHDKKSG